MPEKNTKKVVVKHKKAETNLTSQVEKKVSEEKKRLENFEGKADKEVEKLVWKLWFIEKIVEASWMKKILDWKPINQANLRVRKNLEIICKIIWRFIFVLWIILAVVSVFSFLWWLIALFQGKLWLFLMSLMTLLFTVLIIVLWRWMIKMKKWIPIACILFLLFDIIFIIFSLISKDWNALLYCLDFVSTTIITLFILKNKDLFK